jgi:hypothetical protein
MLREYSVPHLESTLSTMTSENAWPRPVGFRDKTISNSYHDLQPIM